MNRSVFVGALALSSALLSACDRLVPLAPVTPNFSLLVNPAYATIHVGDTLRLAVTETTGAGSSVVSASWTTSDGTSAKVDATGLVTGMRASVPPGVAICASVVNNGAGVQNCSGVTVLTAP